MRVPPESALCPVFSGPSIHGMSSIERENLKAQVLSGLRWTAGARSLGQLVNWAITLLVARLLVPADYGLLAMASLVTALLMLMSELGLGQAMVQFERLDGPQLRRVFATVLLVNAGFILLILVAAPLIAGFFREARLSPILRALSVQFLPAAIAVIPDSLLQRELDFRKRAWVELSAALAGGLTSLGLALAGLGVWALVLGTLASSVTKAVGINLVSPFLTWPDLSLRGMRSLMVFGGYVTVSRLLWFFYSQADVLIAGRWLGKDLLGFYSIALHLASRPLHRISPIISQVLFPAMARIKDEPGTVTYGVLKVVRLLSFFAFPVFWGLSSVAPQLVVVFLGTKWVPATLPLRLLALVMPLRVISNALSPAMEGVGRADVATRNLVAACVIMPVAFAVGSSWGLAGLSLAWVAAFPIVFGLNLSTSLPVLGVTRAQMLKVMAGPGFSGLGMFAVVYATATALDAKASEVVRLVVMIAVGVVSYGAIAYGINRNGVVEVLDLLKRRP